ncbi:MAG: hypothetical protein SNJ77_02355 [Cytophagales bacterium]
MSFEKLLFAILVTLITVSCNKLCEEKDKRIFNKWSDSNVLYEINENGTYSLKYLRANLNPGDTITNTDSAFGLISFTPCKKFITFEQLGRKPRGKDTLIFNRINSGTWDYEFPNDSVLKYRSQTSVGQFFRIKN